MKQKLIRPAQRYEAALRAHLKQGQKASLESARGLGSQALAAGMHTLDLAKLHEHIVVTEVLPDCPARQRAALIKQAGIFFAVAIAPAGETPETRRDESHFGRLKALREATARLEAIIETLSQRTAELAASNLELSQEIIQRQAVEKALKKSEGHYAQLLKQSDGQQEQLRRLSRQILSAQEDERKKISRELHDVVAQTLTAINVRLATLKKEAAINAKGFDRNIARTQEMVEKSMNIVQRFSRELRPAVLDHLGLIPALHSFMKNFTAQTGVRTLLTAFAGVEQFDIVQRTALFRVAQEALTNVARHAQASRVEVTIWKLPDCVCMKIKDDGKSFNVERALRAKRGQRLGLLGMRERLEMVGGSFAIESAPGEGSTILARIPLGEARAPKGKKNAQGRGGAKP